jgi:membrane protease YdiL (CAAX protease family)
MSSLPNDERSVPADIASPREEFPSVEGNGFNTSIPSAQSTDAFTSEPHIPAVAPEHGSLLQAPPTDHSRLAGGAEILPQDWIEPISTDAGPRLFQSYDQPQMPPPARIPHFGHVSLLLMVFVPISLLCTTLLTKSAIQFHLFGVSTLKGALTDVHYTLGSMAILYLLALLASAVIFPLLWHKGFFAGVQWHGATAIRLRGRLVAAAFFCFLLALASGWLMPGPTNAPIDQLFHTPSAAWLMFAFGVSFAPFFEEILFRGFLLPALCTAYDWTFEEIRHRQPPPLGAGGHPQWSGAAMITGSILTSVPFAYMHAEQTGNSLGPLILLFCVSMILCLTRLATRSLAASVMVHSCYNFLLFSVMLLGTSGFRHLEKM